MSVGGGIYPQQQYNWDQQPGLNPGSQQQQHFNLLQHPGPIFHQQLLQQNQNLEQHSNIFEQQQFNFDQQPGPSHGQRNLNKVCEICNVYVNPMNWFKHHQSPNHIQRSDVIINNQFRQTMTGFKNRVGTYTYLTDMNTIDINEVFEECNKSLHLLILNSLAKNKSLKINIQLIGEYIKLGGEELQMQHMYHVSKMQRLVMSDNIEDFIKRHIEEIKSQMADFQERDSGWTLTRIEKFEININKWSGFCGSQYIPTPPKLYSKKACINVRNTDEYCFKWSVISALTSPKPTHPTRTSSYRVDIRQQNILLENNINLNFEGLEFPMPVQEIPKFEKLNPGVSINVYGYNRKDDTVIGPYHISQNVVPNGVHINLLLLESGGKAHYIWIKDMSRLLSSQLTKNCKKLKICDRCLQYTSNSEKWSNHLKECSNIVTTVPDAGNNFIRFKNISKTMDVPFVVYADFECILEKDSLGSTINKHKPCAFSFYIKCSVDSSLDRFKIYTGEDAGEKFVKYLDLECRDIYERYLSLKKPMCPLSPIEESSFHAAQLCHICDKNLDTDRVRDHCHITGKYRGAAHNECNLNYKIPKFIPIFFHNFSSYDCHLFIKDLLNLIPGNTSVIPLNKELYISVSHKIKFDNGDLLEYRFLDSLRFMPSSLDSLAKNLLDDKMTTVRSNFSNDHEFKLMRRKGVFCYEYLDSFQKLKDINLPSIENFYSKLTNKSCSQEDYNHAIEVWTTFNCRTLQDYMELYLKTDVLLLTDIFENFRILCKSIHKLDPCQYFTAPGLSYDAMLKLITSDGFSLELLKDVDTYNFIKNGIRGGITQCSKRYHKANNKYMKNFNPDIVSTFLLYLDVNNLYGWAMQQFLPYGNFKWVAEADIIRDPNVIKNFKFDSPEGYIYEVSISCPPHLHNKFNDLPLAAENKKVGGSKHNKLVADLTPKERYTIHYMTLKQCLEQGYVLNEVHRVLTFSQRPWLKEYIDKNNDCRKKTNIAFEKNFFKLLNNAVYGKTMENVEKRKDVSIVKQWAYSDRRKLGAEALISKPNFHSISKFTDNFWAIQMNKTKIVYDKPIYLGFCILELAKWKMYDFHYNFMKEKFGERIQLNYMDTDSFIYTIESEDVYEEIRPHLTTHFDTSEYSEDNPFNFPLVNKKEIGLMKDENCGKIMTEFVGLGPKMYSYTVEDGYEIKKAKGVKKSVMDNYKIDDYRNCLFTKEKVCDTMLTFRCKLHNIYTNALKKVVLSPLDTKRMIKEDGINTFAWGHHEIESSMENMLVDIDGNGLDLDLGAIETDSSLENLVQQYTSDFDMDFNDLMDIILM
ncbi:uncharacterized protein LOC142231433 [Haematobia irritans]|uniref:uncharacterized protein LOC142231433 n=2 Tax=Haematobia irritans TaxID=7368 RepID=UPI003F507B5F